MYRSAPADPLAQVFEVQTLIRAIVPPEALLVAKRPKRLGIAVGSRLVAVLFHFKPEFRSIFFAFVSLFPLALVFPK